jgi:hypothetical protein
MVMTYLRNAKVAMTYIQKPVKPTGYHGNQSNWPSPILVPVGFFIMTDSVKPRLSSNRPV